MDEWMDE